MRLLKPWLWTAILACCLSMGLMSCSDDATVLPAITIDISRADWLPAPAVSSTDIMH